MVEGVVGSSLKALTVVGQVPDAGPALGPDRVGDTDAGHHLARAAGRTVPGTADTDPVGLPPQGPPTSAAL